MPLQKAVLEKKINLTGDVIQLNFKLETPLNFKAGQFISVKVEDIPSSPCIRGYSISSAPQEHNRISLCVKIVENGRGSNWLNILKEGEHIQFLGPNGKFIFEPDSETKNIIFIATGTGIAPFKSMIEDQLLNKNNSKTKFHLLFGVRYIKDIFYQELFKNLSDQFSNFTYEITVSRPEDLNWKGNTGRVTDLLKNMEISNQKTETYLCGLKDMLTEASSILESKGLSPDKIHLEQYD